MGYSLVLAHGPLCQQQVFHILIAYNIQLFDIELHHFHLIPLLTILFQVDYPIEYFLLGRIVLFDLSKWFKVGVLGDFQNLFIPPMFLSIFLKVVEFLSHIIELSG